jgi:hypothetical protein
MNRCFLLPNAGKADTFCIAQKVSKNASFHKAIAKHRSFSNLPIPFGFLLLLALSCSTLQGRSVMRFSIADGEVKFKI